MLIFNSLIILIHPYQSSYNLPCRHAPVLSLSINFLSWSAYLMVALHPCILQHFFQCQIFFHNLLFSWSVYPLVLSPSLFFPVLKLSSIHRSRSVHLVLPPSLLLLGYHSIAFVNACLSIRTFITHTSFFVSS